MCACKTDSNDVQNERLLLEICRKNLPCKFWGRIQEGVVVGYHCSGSFYIPPTFNLTATPITRNWSHLLLLKSQLHAIPKNTFYS